MRRLVVLHISLELSRLKFQGLRIRSSTQVAALSRLVLTHAVPYALRKVHIRRIHREVIHIILKEVEADPYAVLYAIRGARFLILLEMEADPNAVLYAVSEVRFIILLVVEADPNPVR